MKGTEKAEISPKGVKWALTGPFRPNFVPRLDPHGVESALSFPGLY